MFSANVEIRSAPAVARCYPRDFTFYLGNPSPRFLRSLSDFFEADVFAYGRGAGVGRGRGVGVTRGVTVGVGVGVPPVSASGFM